MTKRDDIIKALKCCGNKGRSDCANCPMEEKRGCAIELYAKALEVIEEGTVWISAKQTPENHRRYLVMCKGIKLPVIRYYGNGWNSMQEVTHWMPLPERPKESEGDEK